jgi:phage shock protein PspC (stress-responsive transcriptional regulator)
LTTSGRTLTALAWGLFFILVGGAWIYGETYRVDTGTIIAIGVGLILIGLNLARSSTGIRMSKFSLALGILALLIGLARYYGMKLDVIPLIIILIGLFIVAEALARKKAT